MTDPHRSFVLLLAAAAAALSAIADDAFPDAAYTALLKPVREIELAAGEPGLIAAVGIARGDSVRAGQVVLTLDSSVLRAQRAIAQSEAADAAAIEALGIKQARAARRVAEMRSLAAEGLGSDDELQQAIVDEQLATLELRAGREEQARRTLKVAEFDARIAARRVVCPVDGLVVEVDREPGEFITAAEPLVAEVAVLSQLRATFYVPTAAATAAGERQPVRLTIPESGQTVVGRIERIARVTAADSGRVRVDVLVDNADGTVRSGLRCELTPAALVATGAGRVRR